MNARRRVSHGAFSTYLGKRGRSIEMPLVEFVVAIEQSSRTMQPGGDDERCSRTEVKHSSAIYFSGIARGLVSFEARKICINLPPFHAKRFLLSRRSGPRGVRRLSIGKGGGGRIRKVKRSRTERSSTHARERERRRRAHASTRGGTDLAGWERELPPGTLAGALALARD